MYKHLISCSLHICEVNNNNIISLKALISSLTGALLMQTHTYVHAGLVYVLLCRPHTGGAVTLGYFYPESHMAAAFSTHVYRDQLTA